MREAVFTAATALYCRAGEVWVAVDEHQISGRIPDLVLARIDLDALEKRVRGGWGRALGSSELRAVRALRPDRGRSLSSIANHLGVSEARTRELLRRLVAEAFVVRTTTGSYARQAPIQPIVDRVVTVEAKRSDLLGALTQARAHSMFADVSIVAFDAAHVTRARSLRTAYAQEGIGLLALAADDHGWRWIERPRRSGLVAALGRALTAERTFARMLGAAVMRLPQTRLPGGFHANVRPTPPQLIGSAPKDIEHWLPGLAPPSPGPAIS